MNNKIEKIKNTRTFLLDLISGLSIDQLNEIPAGFNNNIIWNTAHLVAAQQRLCYSRSGLPLTVDEKYILEYIPGTKPERYIGADETATIKQLLITTLEQFKSDYNNQVFSNSNYDAFVNRYGVELNAIDDVIDYLPYHEGLHGGCIMALKRLVEKK